MKRIHLDELPSETTSIVDTLNCPDIRIIYISFKYLVKNLPREDLRPSRGSYASISLLTYNPCSTRIFGTCLDIRF